MTRSFQPFKDLVEECLRQRNSNHQGDLSDLGLLRKSMMGMTCMKGRVVQLTSGNGRGNKVGQMKGLHGKFESSADTGEHKSEVVSSNRSREGRWLD